LYGPPSCHPRSHRDLNGSSAALELAGIEFIDENGDGARQAETANGKKENEMKKTFIGL
jgi:hypothetical protein